MYPMRCASRAPDAITKRGQPNSRLEQAGFARSSIARSAHKGVMNLRSVGLVDLDYRKVLRIFHKRPRAAEDPGTRLTKRLERKYQAQPSSLGGVPKHGRVAEAPEGGAPMAPNCSEAVLPSTPPRKVCTRSLRRPAVTSAAIVTDRDTGHWRGFGFVKMTSIAGGVSTPSGGTGAWVVPRRGHTTTKR